MFGNKKVNKSFVCHTNITQPRCWGIHNPNMHVVFLRKRVIFGPPLGPAGGQNGSKITQVAPKAPKKHPPWFKIRIPKNKCFQDRFGSDPGHHLGRFGLIFDGFLDVFSMIFEPFSRTPEPLIFDNSTVR